MGVIETQTFRLREGVSEEDFLAADKLMQEEFAYQQYGILRRTTARGLDGRWIVVTLWYELDNARAAADKLSPVKYTFLDLIEQIETAHYETLPG
jgi:hypothetical protein